MRKLHLGFVHRKRKATIQIGFRLIYSGFNAHAFSICFSLCFGHHDWELGVIRLATPAHKSPTERTAP